MQFKVNAQQFYSLLKKVAQCIPSRTSFDIAKKFRIRIDNGVLYVAANNTMAFAEVSMDVDCQNNCSFTLYALDFVKIISKLEGEITFTLKDTEKEGMYDLTCKHSCGRVKFMGYTSEYFEDPIELESDNEFYLSHATFHDAVSHIKHCVYEMNDSNRHAVFIDVYKENAFFVSTNNIELSCIKKNVSCEKNMSVLLNYDFVPLILSLTNKNDEDTMMMIKETKKRIYFFSSDFKASVACFAEDMKYPNYKMVLGLEMIDDEIKVSKADIIKSLDRLSVASALNTDRALMTLDINDGDIHLSATDGITNTILDENIKAVGNASIQLSFRIDYIMECIKSIDCEYVRIQFGKKTPCIKVSSAEKSNDNIDHISLCISYQTAN